MSNTGWPRPAKEKREQRKIYHVHRFACPPYQHAYPRLPHAWGQWGQPPPQPTWGVFVHVWRGGYLYTYGGDRASSGGVERPEMYVVNHGDPVGPCGYETTYLWSGWGGKLQLTRFPSMLPHLCIDNSCPCVQLPPHECTHNSRHRIPPIYVHTGCKGVHVGNSIGDATERYWICTGPIPNTLVYQPYLCISRIGFCVFVLLFKVWVCPLQLMVAQCGSGHHLYQKFSSSMKSRFRTCMLLSFLRSDAKFA